VVVHAELLEQEQAQLAKDLQVVQVELAPKAAAVAEQAKQALQVTAHHTAEKAAMDYSLASRVFPHTTQVVEVVVLKELLVLQEQAQVA
jgi:hypothetical protein